MFVLRRAGHRRHETVRQATRRYPLYCGLNIPNQNIHKYMKVFHPSIQISPYIESYYFTLPTAVAGYQFKRFPAVSCGYLKFSTQSNLVSGQTISPTKIASDVDLAGFGVKLRIGSIYTLFGIPAHELTNRTVTLEDLLGNSAVALIEQIAESSTSMQKIKHLEKALVHLAQQNNRKNFSVEFAVLESLARDPSISVSRLAAGFGYSSRQLQRKLNNFIGLPPRLFMRIRRFEKILQIMRNSARQENLSWSDLAFSCGYSDQAHFIRDFREFTGHTPTTYMADLKMSDIFNIQE
jgi:AraC-like DNA-binding protein